MFFPFLKKIFIGTISGVNRKTLVLANDCVKFSPKPMKTMILGMQFHKTISFVMVSGSDFENHWFCSRVFAGEPRARDEPQEPQDPG